MVTIGVAGAYMSGARGDSVMAPSPARTGGLPADGWVNPPATSGAGLDNQLGMPGPGEVLEDAVAAMVGLSAETAEAFDAVAEAAEAAEAEVEAAAAATAENEEMYRAQLLQSLGQFDLVGPDAELVAGLLEYERELIFETAGASHVEAVEALVAGVPPEIKQKLRAIETQIRAIAETQTQQDPVATQLLEGVTIGEILASIPKGVDAEPILEILRSIVMPAGDDPVDPEAALEALTQVLTDLDGMSSPPGRMSGERPESSPERTSGAGSPMNERDDDAADADRMGANSRSIAQLYKLDSSQADMIAELIEFENILIWQAGPVHDEAIAALAQMQSDPTFSQMRSKLRSIKRKVGSGAAGPEQSRVLEVLTIGEIVTSLPKGVEAEPTLLLIKRIMLGTEDYPAIADSTLYELEKLNDEVEGGYYGFAEEPSTSSPEHMSGSGSSTGERDDGRPDELGAFVRMGLSTEDAEMLYGVLELEKRVFGAEGLDHDEAESIVLSSSGTPEFAAAFHRLRHIELKLNGADQVDPELLEAVAIAEIMLKLPAGENGKQMMGAVRAMVTNGQLSYKQVIQLRDSLPDPSVPDSALLGSTTTTTTTTTTTATTTTTSSSDEPSAPTEEEMVPPSTSTADEKAPATSTSDEEPEDEVNDTDAPAPVAAELEAHDHGATEADTGSGLSDQNIIIITAVSILMLVVAGVVAVAAVRRSRRRSNAAKRVTIAVDPLPVPPLSSEYESTAVIVDEDVYSEEMTTAMV